MFKWFILVSIIMVPRKKKAIIHSFRSHMSGEEERGGGGETRYNSDGGWSSSSLKRTLWVTRILFCRRGSHKILPLTGTKSVDWQLLSVIFFGLKGTTITLTIVISVISTLKGALKDTTITPVAFTWEPPHLPPRRLCRIWYDYNKLGA